MHPARVKFSTQIVENIQDVCNLLSVESSASSNTANAIEQVLGITKEQALEIIKRIMLAFPDTYFYVPPEIIKREMKDEITKSFILFQIQEDIHSAQYLNDLQNFIYELIGTIGMKYQLLN